MTAVETPPLTGALSFIAAAEYGPEATVALVHAATVGMPATEAPRIAAVRLANIEQRDPISVICAEERPVGWYGWFPSAAVPGAWESTTFFTPEMRGTGLFDVIQCRLAHEAADLAHAHGPNTRFFSAIAQWNARSQAAFRSYATRHGWPQAWSTVEEPAKSRTSVVLDWPRPTPHTCHLPVTADPFEEYA